MQLNLPILEPLSSCKSLLIAGMGGGFDIFCGLPIYFELRKRGQTVHLANFSFTSLSDLSDPVKLSDSLFKVDADQKSTLPYFPELYLTQWFREKHGEEVPIWCFEKTGVRPLLDGYRELIEHLSIDGILLIDGGVDSLMQGNEAQTGTLIEDSISLAAVEQLKQVPFRFTACIGFGAEQDMAYAQVLENIAALTKSGNFFGSCSVLPQMESYQLYEEAVLYVFDRPVQDTSVINSSIISATRGNFGNYHLTEKTQGSHLWISPLMPIYWFFDLKAVAERNLILSAIRYTDSMIDAFRSVLVAMSMLPKRKLTRILLS